MNEQGVSVWTVSELNRYMKAYIDASPKLKTVKIKGEISNLKLHSSGHIYFTLKEQRSMLAAVMFRRDADKMIFRPENGISVVCTGRLSVYEEAGQYQLYVTSMEADGVGALYIAYEQLKKRLSDEGLFSQANKKKLPKCPFSIGVITSPTGAAVRDIIKVGTSRFPAAAIRLFPSLVQGDGAAMNIIQGIEYFNNSRSVDVIIIGRGGGSIEDLWAFNDETLARCIYSSKIPIVSAVGHETDFTISDFVADVRAATPSVAAEICFPDVRMFKKQLENVISRMYSVIVRDLEVKKRQLTQLAERRVLTSPLAALDDKRMSLINISERLENAVSYGIDRKKALFTLYSSKLPLLNPLMPLEKGYAVIMKNSQAITSALQLTEGEEFNVRLKDGAVKAKAEKIIKNNKQD